MDFDGFDAVALAPAERRQLPGWPVTALLRGRARLWARKEAWLKMTGDGAATAPEPSTYWAAGPGSGTCRRQRRDCPRTSWPPSPLAVLPSHRG